MSTGQSFIIGTSNALYKITLKDGLSERDSNKMTIAFRGNTKYLPQKFVHNHIEIDCLVCL